MKYECEECGLIYDKPWWTPRKRADAFWAEIHPLLHKPKGNK